MIDLVIALMRFLTQKFVQVLFLFFLCFYSRLKQQKCREDQCIHAYIHILFYKGKRCVITTLTCSCHPRSQYFCIILIATHESSNFTIKFLWQHLGYGVGLTNPLTMNRLSRLCGVQHNLSENLLFLKLMNHDISNVG